MRVSTTIIEKYRRWQDSTSDYDTEESFVESLTKEFKGNAYTAIGTAFHSIAELGIDVCKFNEERNTFDVETDLGAVSFSSEQVQAALKYSMDTQWAVPELKLTKEYNTKYGKVTVVAMADRVWGYEVRDIKTKFSAPKQQEYLDSCQWRYYLEIFEVNDFYFDLFQFAGYKPAEHGMDVSSLQIIRHDPIPCIRYEGMEEDNADLLAGFLEYVFSNNLQEYITRDVDSEG